MTQNALIDYVNERRRQPNPIGGQDGCAHLEMATAREDLVSQLQEAYDLELLDEAVRRVRERVSPRRFEAWELAAKDRLSGAEIGRRLNMPVASVYTSKNQVQNLVQEEIKVLERLAR